ncbi:MAG: hypothetical protein ACT4N8_10670 [Sphingosinicella sp.]|uniref:hypothetical protein n=1 Tax=Sphingosinicella sp. TaxID=1917971 RepID=UPI004037BA72
MILLALALALQTLPPRPANLSFELGMAGWRVEAHRGMAAGIATNRDWLRPQAAQGEAWLNAGWRARSGAPRNAETRIFTSFSAHGWRGRRIAVTAMTRAPGFAGGASRLVVRSLGRDASEASVAIGASEGWRRHRVELAVPRRAEAIEIGFVVAGTRGELDADDIRIETLR